MRARENNPEIRPAAPSMPLFEQQRSSSEDDRCQATRLASRQNDREIHPHEQHAQLADCAERDEHLALNGTSSSLSQAHARRNDPATSKQAAASVSLTNLGRTKDAIISLLRQFGPMTDEQIRQAFDIRMNFYVSPSGLRTRRAWLVENGFVEAAGGFNEDGTTWGITGKTAAKRNCIVWKLK